MSRHELDRRVGAVRRFNRFYTHRMGFLDEHVAETSFGLAEARVLHEIADRGETTVGQLALELILEPRRLGRIVRRFAATGLVHPRPGVENESARILCLTHAGQSAYTELNRLCCTQVERMLEGVTIADQEQLVAAMIAIQQILGGSAERGAAYLLRPHRPGDIGWVVQRHGEIYHREYGWDMRFEALVAEIAAHFVRNFDAQRERCWIAERLGEKVGCVFLVAHPDRPRVARLRLLLVEPKARGLGLGRRLVRECTDFARQAGYETITLWTNSVLHSARRLYEAEGYGLVREEPHHSYGADLIGQDWELDLRSGHADQDRPRPGRTPLM